MLYARCVCSSMTAALVLKQHITALTTVHASLTAAAHKSRAAYPCSFMVLQVDWLAPRPVWEFFSKFSIPKNQTKWTSRLKCNVYYYRTNYLAVLVLALLAAFFRQPLSLLASGLSILALLCFNDPFTAAVK